MQRLCGQKKVDVAEGIEDVRMIVHLFYNDVELRFITSMISICWPALWWLQFADLLKNTTKELGQMFKEPLKKKKIHDSRT